MKKGNLKLFLILIFAPFIVLLVTAACFHFEINDNPWITIITTTTSAACTLFLSFAVLLQTEHYKEREQEDRLQDLKIKANPVVYLNGIERFDFDTAPCVISINDAKNNLLTEAPQKEHISFSSFLSLDIGFSNPAQRLLDYITIEEANLTCYKGNYTEASTYEEFLPLRCKNYSKEKSAIKIGTNGLCISLLSFFSNEIDEKCDEIVDLLNDPSVLWTLNIKYTLSNSCKVYIKYQSTITFGINKVSSVSFCNHCDVDVKDIVTWARSEVCVES